MTQPPVEEEAQDGPYMMCSSCYTPCLVSEGHVIPGWNTQMRKVLTAYRCTNCWLDGIDKTRAVVESGDEDVLSSFSDFLDVQGYKENAAELRAKSAEIRQGVILGILNLLQDGEELFHI